MCRFFLSRASDKDESILQKIAVFCKSGLIPTQPGPVQLCQGIFRQKMTAEETNHSSQGTEEQKRHPSFSKEMKKKLTDSLEEVIIHGRYNPCGLGMQ